MWKMVKKKKKERRKVHTCSLKKLANNKHCGIRTFFTEKINI